MTARKHLKQLVRARMQKTGESYASARRHIVREDSSREKDPAARWHFPGSVPGAAALRTLLAHAGIRDPRTGEPFTESMLFGIAGGIGIGVFSFYYQKEDFASFFVAGRHQWQDDLRYLENSIKKFGASSVVSESGGAAQAAKQLAESIEKYGPTVAWVDAANLPHRAMPESWSGGGYHIITVYALDSAAQEAVIGDLTDDPIAISFKDLAAARQRIVKQKNRILAVAETGKTPDLPHLIMEGLRACHTGLTSHPGPGAAANFQLGALKTWADRIHGSTGKESWDQTFRSGHNLWRGLASIHDFIENYGTGGGLCRPIFAEFLREAEAVIADPRIADLAGQYEELGRQWSALAESALPDSVPLFRETRDLQTRKAELAAAGGSPEEIRGIWTRLDEIREEAGARFPLSPADSASLKASLKERILAIHSAEITALEALRRLAP